MAPPTTRVRIDYFPWSPRPPLGRLDTLSVSLEGHPRLPVEPCGDRALQGAVWLADGEANSFVYFLWNLPR